MQKELYKKKINKKKNIYITQIPIKVKRKKQSQKKKKKKIARAKLSKENVYIVDLFINKKPVIWYSIHCLSKLVFLCFLLIHTLYMIYNNNFDRDMQNKK